MYTITVIHDLRFSNAPGNLGMQSWWDGGSEVEFLCGFSCLLGSDYATVETE